MISALPLQGIPSAVLRQWLLRLQLRIKGDRGWWGSHHLWGLFKVVLMLLLWATVKSYPTYIFDWMVLLHLWEKWKLTTSQKHQAAKVESFLESPFWHCPDLTINYDTSTWEETTFCGQRFIFSVLLINRLVVLIHDLKKHNFLKYQYHIQIGVIWVCSYNFFRYAPSISSIYPSLTGL